MFPKGGMKGLMQQAQKMQKKMKDMEDELKDLRIKGSASGSLVEIEANGKKEILSVKIDITGRCLSIIFAVTDIPLIRGNSFLLYINLLSFSLTVAGKR